MSDKGDLQYVAVIDTSAYDGALDHMVASATEASTQITSESANINDLLTNIPEVNIDFLHNINDAQAMEEGIGQAYSMIAGVIRENQTAINELNQMYAEATKKADMFANSPVDHLRTEAQEARKQAKAIKEVISARREAIKSAQETEQTLDKETQKLLASARAKEKNSVQTQTLRQRIKELENEAAMLVDTASREGRELDQNKGRYRAIIEELGRLRDIRGDIQQAGNVFANDEAHIAGVIQGLSGLSGAFTAAQGTIGLFSGENERLNDIMLKVQSLMAITMGLQQVQQVLNKDSTFSLVTLNAVKQLFNKQSAEAAEVLSEENAEIAENIAETQREIAQDKIAAAAEATDTEATIANTSATGGNTVAQAQQATTESVATAATNAHTGSMIAATVATKTLTMATKLLKVALISTGIGALVVLVGELVAMVVELFTAEEEAVERTQALQKINEESAETYIKARIALEKNIKMCQEFSGSKEQEKKKVEALNAEYGKELGYYDSLNEWKRVLIERGTEYCKMLQMEAQTQGYLNKYVESYVALKDAEFKANNGDFDAWYRWQSWDDKVAAEEVAKFQKNMEYWENEYLEHLEKLETYKKKYNFDVVHINPIDKSNFDYKSAAPEQKKLIDDYEKALAQYNKNAHAAISQAAIDSMKEGYAKEMLTMRKQMSDRKEAWQQQLMQLAMTLRDTTKAYFLTQKGATEEKWDASEQGQRSLTDWAKELLKKPQIADNYTQGLLNIDEALQRGLADIRDKYFNQLVDDFGTYNQKFDKLQLEWQKKIAFIGSSFPDFLPAVLDKMDEAISRLQIDDFKRTINWDVVFGNLDDQSLQSLQFSLDKMKTYFAQGSKNMSVEQAKTFQEAIEKIENEIASRNPFAAMHKSFSDIIAAKDEFVSAIADMKKAQDELNVAEKQYEEALNAKNAVIDKIDQGELAADCIELTIANDNLKESTTNLAQAQKKNANAEQRTLTARNAITKSYKTFASNLSAAGAVTVDVGKKASNLARVLGLDISNGMDKALECIDAVLGGAMEVISSIGDVGKSVAKGMTETVDSMGIATEATAQATANSISTVEKASVILAVISAALQIATAIANLFNNDDEKQEEIERLQGRIDQLQWELDNISAVRLQKNAGDALELIKQTYSAAREEVLSLHGIMQSSASKWPKWIDASRVESEIFAQTVEKIADHWASVGYAADKALGEERYKESREQLENLARQQVLVQRQLEEEQSKKNTDDDKIQDFQQKIAELAEEMATLINEMMEDIIGTSAEDIAKQLGDAFFDAVKQGEDAMQSWHDKVNELVADIVQRMMIQQLLEQPIGRIFDKYKQKWFGTDGTFQGIDNVIASMNDFSNDLNAVSDTFQATMNSLPDEVSKWFTGDERQASERGIATASQDSVDENNARLTTIQSHTYTLVQSVAELNATGNQILDKLSNIDNNTQKTSETLDAVKEEVRRVKDAVEDITTKGIRLKA